MKYSLRSLILVVALVCLLTSPLSGEEKKPDAAKPMVPNSEPHSFASEKLTKILIGDASEQRCASSPEDVVALHAAWRKMDLLLRRQKEDAKAPRTIENSAEYVIGFIEGRSGVICPKWWKEAILSATVHESGHLAFKIPEEKGKRVVHEKMHFPAGTKVAEEDGGLLHIIRGDQSVDAPKTLIHEEANGSRQVEFTTDNDSAFIAFYSSNAQVLLLKVRGREKKWAQILRGEWFIGNFIGPGERQRVEIVVSKGRIFVFAGLESVIYFEVFDANEGTRLSRFSSRAYNIEK